MKKYILYTFIALLFVAVSGCKDFLEINTNPNAPTVTVPDLVLSGALTETARIISQDMNNYAMFWAGYWSASGTYSASGDIRRFFNLQNTSFQGVWQDNYLNASNYNYVEGSSRRIAGYDNYVAISKIMKVYNFHTLIDNYGNLPYNSALKGFRALSPTYDDASVVYEQLSAQLDSAVAIIQNAPATAAAVPATTDIMFKGDMTLWTKLANTMNLRLLLRQSEVSSKAAFISSEIAKITANGAGFLGADQNATINPGYTKAANLQNPFWESNGTGVGDDIGNRDYNRASDYSVVFFVGPNYATTGVPRDSRANRLFRAPGDLPGVNTGPSPTNHYKGIPFGQPPDLPFTTSNTSAFGLGVMGSPSSSVVFLSASQSLFLQAEAVERGWMTGDVQALYESGITESFKLLGVPDAAAEANTYYTSGLANKDFSASPNKLKAIMIQKWAANCSIDAMEAWCDLRRTGYPDDLPQSLEPAKINPTPPVRLLYPQTEFSNNAGAIAAALQAQGFVDQFVSRIFWDVN